MNHIEGKKQLESLICDVNRWERKKEAKENDWLQVLMERNSF